MENREKQREWKGGQKAGDVIKIESEWERERKAAAERERKEKRKIQGETKKDKQAYIKESGRK